MAQERGEQGTGRSGHVRRGRRACGRGQLNEEPNAVANHANHEQQLEV